MRNIQSKYKIPFSALQIFIAFILAVSLQIFNPPLKDYLPIPEKLKKTNKQKSAFNQNYTHVINGFENISKHIYFKKLKNPLDKKVIMLGACQISSLHWHYWPGGFDRSGRSSLPYNLDKELKKNPATSNIYVYNFGMEGTGYVESLYFLLTTLEEPNLKLVIYSIGQEAENHIPNYNKARYKSYIRFLPKLAKLLEYYHKKYPDIEELSKYYKYVQNNPWTKAGFQLMKQQNNDWQMSAPLESSQQSTFSFRNYFDKFKSHLEYNKISRQVIYNTKWITTVLKNTLDKSKHWLQSEQNINSENTKIEINDIQKKPNLKPVSWYIKNFKPRKYKIKNRKRARYAKQDRLVLRLMAKLLAHKKIDLWIQNPADIAVNRSKLVDKKWWQPLKASLAEFKNVKTIDMSSMPMENGLHTAGRVAPTYYGTLKTMKAFIPYIEEWNKND